jgi:hypothetical protein
LNNYIVDFYCKPLKLVLKLMADTTLKKHRWLKTQNGKLFWNKWD